MKWYIASRMRHKKEIELLQVTLEKHGQEIVFKWTDQPSFKPYDRHLHECQYLAGQIDEAIRKTDIFILLGDAAGTDMFIELGIFLGHKKQGAKAYVIGPHNRRSLMHHHPQIIPVDKLSDITNEILREASQDITLIDKRLIF